MVDFSLTAIEKELIELSNLDRLTKQATARYWDYNESLMPADPLVQPVPVNPAPDPKIISRFKDLMDLQAKDKNSNNAMMLGSIMRMTQSVGGGLEIVHYPPKPIPTLEEASKLTGAGLGNASLRAAGTEEQKKKWGGYNLAMANTEPGCGSDSKAIETTARLDGDEWVLNGEKIFVTGGIRCHGVVIWATLDKTAGRGAIKCFVVMKGTPGFELAKKEKKLGIRESDTAAFVLKDCHVPRENLLGLDETVRTGGGGFKGLMQTFNMTRPGVGAGGVAQANSGLDFVTREMKKEGIEVDWEADSPKRDAIQEKLVDLEAQIEAARLTVLRANWLAANGKPNNLEASVCKAKGGGVGRTGCQLAIELLGAIGITHDTLVEKAFRDARITDIFEGTGEINRLIIARAILNYSSEDLM